MTDLRITDADDGVVLDKVLTALTWNGRNQKIQAAILMASIFAQVANGMSVVFLGKSVPHHCADPGSLTVNVHNTTVDVLGNNSDFRFVVTYQSCSIDVTNGNHAIAVMTDCGDRYEYDEPVERSFVSEWDLVCSSEHLSDLSQTFLALGQIVGALFLTGLADIYGRKPTLVITNFLFLATAVAMAFAPNFIVYVIIKFLLGAFQLSSGLIANVLLIEILPTQHRALPEQVASYLWPCSLLFLCLVAYVLREFSWRYTQLILAATTVHAIVQWWIIDESLRWLVAKKRNDEAVQLVRKIAQTNSIRPDEALDILSKAQTSSIKPDEALDILSKAQTSSIKPDEALDILSKAQTNSIKPDKNLDNLIKATVVNKKSLTISVLEHGMNTEKMSTSMDHTNTDQSKDGLDGVAIYGGKNLEGASEGAVDIEDINPEEIKFSAIIRNRNVLKITFISCFTWFADSVTYDGLLMTSSSLADDLYLGFVLSVLAEFPAAFAFSGLVNRIGRKKCVNLFHITAGLSLLTSVILSYTPLAGAFPGMYVISVCVSLLGKMAAAAGYSAVYLYTPELFPTNLRNTGNGISAVASQTGAMVAPFTRTFARHIPWGPGLLFALLCLTVPVLTRFLPETHGHELPQTVGEMDEWLNEWSDKREKRTAALRVKI
ncbi:unnamed protein product [Lymnaea stagnalis]|uniref:Major facilitator superfamily (MFS) profile domain-containing protein n=1 Tax=Lymnaea stagnalis TaxID=6523 RepID=A0AAV2IQN3_LYMST